MSIGVAFKRLRPLKVTPRGKVGQLLRPPGGSLEDVGQLPPPRVPAQLGGAQLCPFKLDHLCKLHFHKYLYTSYYFHMFADSISISILVCCCIHTSESINIFGVTLRVLILSFCYLKSHMYSIYIYMYMNKTMAHIDIQQVNHR